jgi:hypothetical protein
MLSRIDLCLLAVSTLLLVYGCGGSSSDAANQAAADGKLPFKLGIMTGTVSQGEDEYRGAERVIRKYGADRIKHVTYPDNFMVEQETMIAQILNLAADPQVEAIVIAQGVPGSMAAMKKVHELRPEMIFILDNPHEDPHQVASYADLCIIPDDLKRGETIVELAHEMGATNFIHYSFPRHMSQELLARRKDIMENKAKDLGMGFVYINAPDPTGDQGLPGAQKFILEDVPREIAQYGEDTAFFSTNCGMQEPLIRAVMDNGAIFPEQCCPSPTHGYPGALGIPITQEQAGDMAQIRGAISRKVEEQGQQGRMATWPVSIGIVTIEAAVELAIKAVKKEIQLTDPEVVKAAMEEAAGAPVILVPFEGKDNYYLVLLDSVIF